MPGGAGQRGWDRLRREAGHLPGPEGAHWVPLPSRRRASARGCLPRAAAFWTVGATLVAFLAAAGAPTPLYVMYQHELRFSPITLTIIFAVYSLALLLTLLTVGALSDHVGRRPVLVVSLVVEVASMIEFMRAHTVDGLLSARVLQGLATGAATGAISAYLIDLAPRNRLKLGPLVTPWDRPSG